MPKTDLSRGPHADPAAGVCLMERVSAIAGEPFSDRPSCTHPALAALAQQVNDRVSDAARDRLLLVTEALRRLTRSEQFMALLEDEGLTTMPENIAARLDRPGARS